MKPQTQEIDGKRFAKVRIPVAVNRHGEWLADGFYSREREEAMAECENGAAECGLGNVFVHFVYALVPLPDDGLIITGNADAFEEKQRSSC